MSMMESSQMVLVNLSIKILQGSHWVMLMCKKIILKRQQATCLWKGISFSVHQQPNLQFKKLSEDFKKHT